MRRASAIIISVLVPGLIVISGCRPREPVVRLSPEQRARGLALTRFEDVLALPEEEIDLATAALLLPRDAHSPAEIKAARSAVDELAARARRSFGRDPRPSDCIRTLNRLILGEDPVRAHDPEDPEGLSLSHVIESKRGNCLGISVLYLALAERLGLPLSGVAAPGHFLVRFSQDGWERNIDPSRLGGSFPDKYYRRWRKIPSGEGTERLYLRPLSKREMLALLAANRAGLLLRRGEPEEAEREADLAVGLCRPPEAGEGSDKDVPASPAVSVALTNRALARERRGDLAGALADNEAVIGLDPCAAAARANLAAMLLRRPASAWADMERASELARRATELRPDEPRFWRTAGRAAEMLGRSREADRCISRAERLERSRGRRRDESPRAP